MPTSPLPTEVYSAIVARSSRSALTALCSTSRALQTLAEPLLYHTLELAHPDKTYAACLSLGASARLGAHVRSLAITVDARRWRTTGEPPLEFWTAVRAALRHTTALRMLALCDYTYAHGWVLRDAPARGVRGLRLHLKWGADVARFIAAQPGLRQLEFHAPEKRSQPTEAASASADADTDTVLPAGALPALTLLDASVDAAARVLPAVAALTHIQITFPEETAFEPIEAFVRVLARAAPRLQALNILDIPEDAGADILDLVVYEFPRIRHLGFVPLPPTDRSLWHALLLDLPALRSLELGLVHWDPAPPLPHTRALAAELRQHAPALARVGMVLPRGCADWAAHPAFVGSPDGVGGEKPGGGGLGGEFGPWMVWVQVEGLGRELRRDLWREDWVG